MKERIHTTTRYIQAHKQVFSTAAISVIGVAVLVGLFMYNQPKGPNIVYQPVKACELLTPEKAMDVLGDKVNNVESNEPTITDDTATSQCAYTDTSTDSVRMQSLTIAVSSAINDEGIADNKAAFSKRKAASKNTETIPNLGESAYYDNDTNLLQVLSGKRWIMVNYGTGEGPTPKPIEDIVSVARNILK